jgi:hypothetical protein
LVACLRVLSDFSFVLSFFPLSTDSTRQSLVQTNKSSCLCLHTKSRRSSCSTQPRFLMKRTHDLFCTGTPRGPGSGRVTSIISKFIYTRLVLHLLSELTVESWTLKPQLVLHNTGKYWTTDLNSALLKAGLVEGELNEIHGREIILPYNSSSTKQPLGSIRTLCSIFPPKNSSCSSAIMYLAAPKKAWFANLRKLTDSRNQDHGVRFTLQWMVINRKQWLDLPCVLQRIGVYMQRRDAYLCC